MKAARSATGRAMMVATTPQGHARRSSQFAPGGEGQQQDESVFETRPLAASSGVELGDDQLANVQSTRRLRHALTSKGTGMLGMLDLNHDGALTEQEAEAALRMAGNDNTDDVKAALHKGSSASAAAALERITAGTLLRLPCKELPFVPDQPDVSVAAKILNISQIDCVNQAFFCTLDLWVCWDNPDLDPNDPATLKGAWQPSVSFHNAIANTIVTRGARDVGDHSFTGKTIRSGLRKGQWFYSIECTAMFREIMELRDFTFDCQELTIAIRMNHILGTCAMKDLAWGDDGESVVFEPTLSVPEWTVCTPKTEVAYYPKFMFGHAEDNYDPCLRIVLRVRRTWRFYCYNLGPFIVCMPMLAASPVFFSVTDGMEIRVGIDFTLVLTCVALKFLLHGNLPNVPYLTLLDKYVLASFGMICLMTVENGIISHLSTVKGEQYARDVDVWIWVGFGLGWCLFHIYAFLRAYRLVSKRNADMPPVYYLDHTDVTHGVQSKTRYFEDAKHILADTGAGVKASKSKSSSSSSTAEPVALARSKLVH